MAPGPVFLTVHSVSLSFALNKCLLLVWNSYTFGVIWTYELTALLNKTTKNPRMNKYRCVRKLSCLSFICMAYLNMPEMFTDRATDSNCTKEVWYKILWLVGVRGINFEQSVVATLCGLVTNFLLIFLLIMSRSMQAVRTVCFLIGTFACKSDESFNLWNIFSYFDKPGSLCFVMKTQRHEYRQYQFSLRKGNTLTVIRRNSPDLYTIYTITVCTHTTNYHWEVSREI